MLSFISPIYFSPSENNISQGRDLSISFVNIPNLVPPVYTLPSLNVTFP